MCDVDRGIETCDTALMDALVEYGKRRALLAGETLCEYGDTARHLWLLLEGHLAATAPDLPKEVLHGDTEKPCLIGEAAFFTDQKRHATLRCVTDIEVSEIDFEKVRELRRSLPELREAMESLFRERLVDRLLSSHAVFKFFNSVDRKRIALTFNTLHFPEERVIIDFDEDHDGAYMLQSGSLNLIETPGGNGNPRELHVGDMVHLGGLLEGYRSSYRVATTSPSDLLHLPRKYFEPFIQRRPWVVPTILQNSRFAIHRKILKPEDRLDVWMLEQRIQSSDRATMPD